MSRIFRRVNGVWYLHDVHVYWFNWRFLLTIFPLLAIQAMVLVPAGFVADCMRKVADFVSWKIESVLRARPRWAARIGDWACKKRQEEWEAVAEEYQQKHGPKFGPVVSDGGGE